MSNFASNSNMTALFTAAGEKIGERAKIFPGTKAEWDALPLSEKIKYDYVAFAGDSQSGIVDDVPTENSENLVKSGGVYDSLATKVNLTQITNPNILHNPWFQVNQRQATTISSSDAFIVDRWKTNILSSASGTFTVNEDGTITIASTSNIISMYQKRTAKTFTRLKGRKVTLSVMLADGTIYSGTGVVPSSGVVHVFNNDDIAIGLDKTKDELFMLHVKAGKTVTIKAVKLELGSVSTLAMDTAPNYQQELAKCQRYFYRANMNIYCSYGIATAWSTAGARMLYQTPVPMRVKPAITFGDISVFKLRNGSTYLPITQAILYGSDNTDKFYLELNATTVSGTIYTLDMTATSYIDFSADL